MRIAQFSAEKNTDLSVGLLQLKKEQKITTHCDSSVGKYKILRFFKY